MQCWQHGDRIARSKIALVPTGCQAGDQEAPACQMSWMWNEPLHHVLSGCAIEERKTVLGTYFFLIPLISLCHQLTHHAHQHITVSTSLCITPSPVNSLPMCMPKVLSAAFTGSGPFKREPFMMGQDWSEVGRCFSAWGLSASSHTILHASSLSNSKLAQSRHALPHSSQSISCQRTWQKHYSQSHLTWNEINYKIAMINFWSCLFRVI